MNKSYILYSLLLLALFPFQATDAQYLSGYGRELQGETIRYESHQPDATQALLVRSLERTKFIEWETDTLPSQGVGGITEFVMLAGIDVNPGDNHRFDWFINDELQFSFRNPVDTLNMDWELEGTGGITLRMKGMMIDKYGDLFGYLFLRVPDSLYPAGKPLKIRVEGETANSRSWFMVFKYTAVQQVKFIQEKALVRDGEGERQLVRVDILHFDKPTMAAIEIGNSKEVMPIELGFNMVRIPVNRVEEPTPIKASVRLNDREIANQQMVLEPVGRKTIYLLPHSHNDIGYTHVQEEVEAIQWQNIRDAVKYSRNSSDYPQGSQFKWNGEVMWAIDSYLRQCSPDEKAALTEAVQKGWFELDGLYANILTGLCRPEELFRMMESAVRTAGEMGVDLRSAMITDIPGYTWSIVPVMAQSGIRYFSIGTNTFHRIGDIIETWGDRPFYWESASGKEKVLCWVHGKGYSEFHTGLAYTRLRNKLKEQVMFDYISELEAMDYPYDIVTMRYNIGSDNGPPDPYLSDIVRVWNEKYSSPRLVISTVGEAFSRFEAEYGNSLPTYRGDLTGYWEDGAASSAAETAMNRSAAERLTQASKLWSIIDPDGYPGELFDRAWENVLLFSEHTWGSWNSISEPDNPFTVQQWNTKQSFAHTANGLSTRVLNSLLPESLAETATQVDVYNTSSWMRTDLVRIPAVHYTAGDRVRDEEGRIIPSQRLNSGELVFVAEDIPPFSSRRFFFERVAEKINPGDETDELFYPYDHVKLELNEELGTISSLLFRHIPEELSDDPSKGLNQFIYVAGRNPENAEGVTHSATILKEDGPVMKTIRIESDAPGCSSLTREITMYKKLDRIDIVNIIDKKDIRDPEGVHFMFPFRVPDGRIRISNACGYYDAGREQLPGSNLNFFSVNRWVDISNKSYGITFIPVDAPLIEIGGITCDPIEVGWIDTLAPSQTIASYVMNNYWETNYKASQWGRTIFRYSICPHRGFDPMQAEKRGIEQHQPLLAVITDRFMTKQAMDFQAIQTDKAIIENIIPVKGTGLLVRLYNPYPEDVSIEIHTQNGKKNAYLSDPFGRFISQLDGQVAIAARQVIHLVITEE